MTSLTEFAVLAYDDAACAWHRYWRDAHARALAAAVARRAGRVAAWVGPGPDRPGEDAT